MTPAKQKRIRMRQRYAKSASVNAALGDCRLDKLADQAFLRTERGKWMNEIYNLHLMKKLGETT